MNTLFLDFLYPKGHKRMNHTYMSYLAEIGNVHALTTPNMYTDLPSNVELHESNLFSTSNGKVKKRLSTLLIMILSAFYSRRIEYDNIFITTYDTIMFLFGRYLFRRSDRIFLFHHFNIDELNNGFKKWCFKKYMNKVEHVVFENFIKNHLINEYGISPEKVHILPHSLNQNDDAEKGIRNIKYHCVGLSNSNDDNIISEIIKVEEERGIFKSKGLKVVLKSKSHEFDNGSLKIIKGFLADEEYNDYINYSHSIYLPFPKNFKYRMSGMLVDALSNCKIVYGSKIPIIKEYSNKYPFVCNVVDSPKDLFELMEKEDSLLSSTQQNNFKQFIDEHAKTKIIAAFTNMFEQ